MGIRWKLYSLAGGALTAEVLAYLLPVTGYLR
jgi:hypothetical protein